MTARRFPFRRASDPIVPEAVAPLLAELRESALVAPRACVAAAHAEMMRLERQLREPVGPAPRSPLGPRRRVHVPVVVSWPRRTACLIVAVCLAFAGAGLDAVGALPAPLQHISDTIKQHLGIATDVPRADGAPQAARVHHVGRVVARTATPLPGNSSSTGPKNQPAGSAVGVDGRAASRGGSAASGSTTLPVATPTLPPVTIAPSAQSGGPSKSPRPGTPSGSSRPPTHTPPKKKMQSGGGPPPGFPVNWQGRAVVAALEQLRQCAAAVVLAPVGCPQQARAAAPPTQVRWTALNEPLAGAIAIAQPLLDGGTGVTVYGRFQMRVSYTEPGDATPTVAYSSGLTQATMTLEGSGFTGVIFTPISPAQLPPGVSVPTFTAPAGATDSALLAAVRAGLRDCVAAWGRAPSGAFPNCPAPISGAGATAASWALVGDPTLGASISFDSARGDFSVAGTYNLTRSETGADGESVVTTVSGRYVATLVCDGSAVGLVRIAEA